MEAHVKYGQSFRFCQDISHILVLHSFLSHSLMPKPLTGVVRGATLNVNVDVERDNVQCLPVMGFIVCSPHFRINLSGFQYFCHMMNFIPNILL